MSLSRLSKNISSQLSLAVASTPSSLSRAIQRDPEFIVVTSGQGSFLQCKFSENSEVTAKSNSAIGLASHIQSTFVPHDGALQASIRKLTGNNFFFEKFESSSTPGDVILSPKSLSDIALIKLEGNAHYYVRSNSLLAFSSHLSLSPSVSSLGLKNGALSFKFTGKGTVAISAPGTIFKMTLTDGQSFKVNPNNLIAWNSLTNPTGSIGKESKGNIVVRTATSAWSKFKNLLMGTKGYYTITGPGDVYLSSKAPSINLVDSFRSARERLNERVKTPKAEKPKEEKPQEEVKEVKEQEQSTVTSTEQTVSKSEKLEATPKL